VTGQLLRHDRGRHVPHAGQRLHCYGQAGIIQEFDLPGDPHLQCFQHCRLLTQWCPSGRDFEERADHYRQLLRPLSIARAQFFGELDRGRGGRAAARGEPAHARMLHEAGCPGSDEALRELYLAGLN
jgi:hypothetical protein